MISMFKEIKLIDIKENLWSKLNKEWGLITAGSLDDLNTMTISWGAFGTLWYKDMLTVYIRSTRHTVKYLDREKYFSLSFYDNKYKKSLGICGSESGRDIDKIKKIGFTKCFDKAPYFKEASLVLICRKVAKTDMTSSIIYDNSIKEKEYGTGDYHYMYNGIIEKVLVKDSYE